ncbi:hypothetical protein AQPE_1609 [Aquipluma nitroreducens]|uniref:Uncharacterized protein n=1 Tax=Aquipluma nitroreducens TaxID=2010828 RepID=A0A5K7S7N4_9BACT|nr:hypothetical protein AQPE_1609 [Aquipluma nitroreducens]
MSYFLIALEVAKLCLFICTSIFFRQIHFQVIRSQIQI